MSIPKAKQEQYKYAKPTPFRTCKQCKELVSKDLFWKDKSQWDGLERVCKNCNKGRMKKRRYNQKLKIIKYLGGECVECGVTLKDIHHSAFDCNHKDPKKKSFGIGQSLFLWDKLQPELDKCELMCSNCHRRITWEQRNAAIFI